MLYKKNWITYLGYTIFALFLSGLFIINSQLYNNFSENNLVLLISVFICSELIVLVLYLIALITSIVNNKIKNKTSNVIYYIIWWTIFLIAILIRAGYIMYYVESFNIYTVLISFTVNILKILLLFYIAKIALGRISGIIALFLESFLACEIVLCNVIDYNTISTVCILFIILLYTIYFKRCNNNKAYKLSTSMLVVLMTIIISAGIGVSIYLDYSIIIPVVMLSVLLISMLFAGWRDILILLFGTAIICIGMYFGTGLFGYEYTQKLNTELQYRISSVEKSIEKYVSDPEETFIIIEDKISEKNENGILPTAELPYGYSVNCNSLINMTLILLSFFAIIMMYVKNRNSLFPVMLYTCCIYLFADNILSCSILMICYMLQNYYNKRDDKSFIVNDAITNNNIKKEEAKDTDKQELKNELITNTSTDIIDNKDNNNSVIAEEPIVEDEFKDESVVENSITEELCTDDNVTVISPEDMAETDKIDDPANLDKYIIENYSESDNDDIFEEHTETQEETEVTEKTEIAEVPEITETAEISEKPEITEETAVTEEPVVTEKTDVTDIISSLPIPKAIVSMEDENAGKTKIKNNSAIKEQNDNSFNNDLWSKRKARILNKNTQKENKNE